MEGFEPSALEVEAPCSVQLSYMRGFFGAGGGNRTRAYRMEAYRSATELHQQMSGADGGGRTRNLPVTKGMLCH